LRPFRIATIVLAASMALAAGLGPTVPALAATPSDPPTNVSAVVDGFNSATVSWSAPAAQGGSPVYAYAIYAYSYTGTAQEIVTSNPNSAAIYGLTSGAYYVFTVTAFNSIGWSGWSNWSSWALMNQSLPGNVQVGAQGIVVHPTQGGTEEVDVRSDHILQVSYVASGSLGPRTSLSVVASWPARPGFGLVGGTGSVMVKTGQVTATVDTNTGLISYADAQGTALTAEQSKTFSPSPSTAPGVEQQVDTTFSSPSTEGLFGLGQQQDGIMDYKGHEVTLDQTTVVGTGGEIGMPVMMSSRGYGLLWDTYSRSVFYGDANNSTSYRFSAQSDSRVDYYFMYGPTLDTVVSDYRLATGPAPMFPQWAYGLFQSKDHYGSQAELLGVANTYRQDNIPLDAIVQDWQYWTPNPWGSHIMDPTRYPDPKAMLDQLHAENLHGMISVWAKFDPGSNNYNQLNAANCFYHDSRDGQTYGNYYDAYSAQCRSIYSSQVMQELFNNYGWDAFWLDASEWESPGGVRAYVNTAAGPGVDYYNAYPLEHSQSLYDAELAQASNTKRVFTLTRSAYAGQQRNAAAVWSGDTHASFDEMANQMTGGLNFSLSGMPYWTEDIGGYFAGDWTTAANNELFTRWFEKGAFDPIFRIHGQGSRELYGSQWNAQTQAALLATDQLRYRLMPYTYSLASMVTQDNYTIMRPLVMDFQNDPKVYGITDEYMYGPSILVAPVDTAGATSRSVYLPGGLWYDFWTGQSLQGGQTITAAAPYDHIPLYVKAGSILPLGPANAQYAAQAVNPTEIRVYPGADGALNLYSDSGDSYAYTQGTSETIPLTYTNSTGALTIGAKSGSYPGMPTTRNMRVVFVQPSYGTGLAETPTAPTSNYQGTTLNVSSQKQVSGPVQPPFATHASTQATFGQSATQFEIDAAGTDIFQNGLQASDDYGSIYIPGGAGTTTTATVRVDSQGNTDPWAKAGLVMRNDLTKDHQSPGYVALVATPGSGISFQWDASGDGILDSFLVAGPTVKAPVWLKLSRSNNVYTGYYSTDNSNWSLVGSATVGSAAATQDVGMIATSHNPNQLSVVTFSGFSRQ
jgi:alpha-D-xyloside xylohydrolase